MRDAITAFLRSLSGLRASRTISTYRAILETFAAFCASRGSDEPGFEDVELFLARARADGRARAVSSRNQALAAIRVFAEHALRSGALRRDPTDGIPFAREARRDPIFLTVFQLRRLFQVAATHARPGWRERDLALLALLTQAGLRVSELVGLDLENVDLEARHLVGVAGKGGGERSVPLSEESAMLIEAWLAARGDRAATEERAFLVGQHGGRLSIRSVERLFTRWRTSMGNLRLHPHLMRHSFITNAIALGGDVVSLQHLAGHESIRSTQRYAHVVDGRRLDAVRRLAVAIPPELLSSSATQMPTPSAGATGATETDFLPSPASTIPVDDEEPFVGAG